MPGILTASPVPVSSGHISSGQGPAVKGPLGMDQRDKQGQRLQNQLPTVTKNCGSCVGWGSVVCGMGVGRVWDGACVRCPKRCPKGEIEKTCEPRVPYITGTYRLHRDWYHCDKPSRQEATTSRRDDQCHLANAFQSRFSSTLRQNQGYYYAE